MLPNFLIIGAQKAGTTTLWHLCDRHPDIFMAPQRETGFFYNDAVFNAGLPGYELQFFSGWRGERAVGEKTPEYLLYRQAAERIRMALGDGVRLVVLLRDPARRAESGWRHNLMLGWESLPFAAALAAEQTRVAANPMALARFGYAARGRYATQLSAYFKIFGVERIHVVLFDELVARQGETTQDVFRFLGVDPIRPEPAHEGRPVVQPFEIVETAKGPLLRRGASALHHPSPGLLHFARQLNTTLEAHQPLTAAAAAELNRQVFGEEIAGTARLIGRRLDAWLDGARA